MYTLIKLNLDHESRRKLTEFLEENKDIITKPKENFHSTIHYSEETPVFKREGILKIIGSYLPITISPQNYYFDIFGKTDLVLGYQNPEIMKLKEEIMSEAIRQMICKWSGELSEEERDILENSRGIRTGKIYFDFNPHVTFSKSFKKDDLERLTMFEHEIVFDDFSWTQEK